MEQQLLNMLQSMDMGELIALAGNDNPVIQDHKERCAAFYGPHIMEDPIFNTIKGKDILGRYCPDKPGEVGNWNAGGRITESEGYDNCSRWTRSEDPDSSAFHYWVVDDDGNIIDPVFDEYEIMKKLFKLEGPPVYQEWSITNQLKKMKKQNILDKRCYEKNSKRIGISVVEVKSQCMRQFLNRPEFCKCNMNAMAIKNANPTYKLKIGNMGWRDCNGRVWWHY